jgi:hypothetical protein
MGGLSVAFIFAMITRLVEREARFSPELGWIPGREPSNPAYGSTALSDRQNEIEKGRH